MGAQLESDLRSIMMGEDEEVDQSNPLSIGTTSWSFLDGDTVKDSVTGESVRLRGINTLETSKHIKELGYEFSEGEVGGDATTSHIWSLANKHGFTNVVKTGEKGFHGRDMGDLLNDEGHSFVDTLLRSGLAAPWHFSSEDDLELSIWGGAAEAGRPDGTPKNDFEKARDAITAVQTEHYNGLPIQKMLAFNAEEYNSNPDLFMGMKNRTVGADYEGKSRTPFSTSWDVGFATLYKSLNTFGQKAANLVGATGVEASFAADVADNESYITSQPTVKMDVTEIDWLDYDEVTTGLMGMLGTSLPFMATTLTGMALAPITLGTSMSVPVAMYSGMVLDEMEGQIEDKNFGIAIAAGAGMTVLDRLGIKGLISPKMMMTSAGRKEAIEAISRHKMFEGLSREQALQGASNFYLTQSKKQLLGFVDDAKAFGASQLQKSQLFKEGVRRLGKSSASEGVTEAMQELTQYTAAVIGSEKEWDYDEVQHKMTNAIVAGGLMGGGFAAPSFGMEVGGWKAAIDFALDDDGRFDGINKEVEDRVVEENNGVLPTIDDIKLDNQNADRIEREGRKTGLEVDVPEHISVGADQHTTPGTTIEHIWAFLKNPKVAVRGAVDNTTRKARSLSPTFIKMTDMIGSTRNRLFPGRNMETTQRLKVADFAGKLRDQEVIEASFNAPRTMSSAGRSEFVSDLANRFMEQVLRPSIIQDGVGSGFTYKTTKALDWSKADADVLANKDALLALDKELQSLADSILQTTNSTRKITGEDSVGKLDHWAYRHKSFRREHIAKNRSKFSALLSKEYGMPKAVADELTDNIINNESISTLAEAFDITKGGVNPSFQKSRKLHISDRAAFNDFLEQNIFKNMGDASREAARFQAHREFLGKDNANVNRMFQEVHSELLETMEPEAALKLLNELKYDIRNILNAESGNYKPIQNQFIKQFQKYLTMLTTLQSLSMAAASSMPEMGMIVEGVPKEIIVKNAASSGYLFGGAIGAYLRNLQVISRTSKPRENMETYLDKKLSELRTKNDTDPRFVLYTNLKQMLKETGFKAQETGAATTTGVQDTNEFTRGIADAFFKANFLVDQQDMHRMMRLSFFNDFLISKLDLIQKHEGTTDTVGSAEAKMMMRELGIPVGLMLDLGNKLKNLKDGESLSPTDAALYKREFLNGATNFVNQAIPLPNAMNRPLYYSDPHFVMLTQFNGFTSTFTANQLPRLWDQLKGNSSKGLQYGTVAAMSNMLLLAFLSQGLKDELKYGDDGNPYLTDAQKIQRAIYSSGLLGTTERVIGSNFLFPLYGTDSYGAGDFVWENVAGEAAASSTVSKMYNMISGAIESDGAKFERNFYASLPIVGPFKYRLQNYKWE